MATIEVSGTASSAPGSPQSADQTASDTSTTNGLRLTRRPTRRGSSTLPTKICAAVRRTASRSVQPSSPNWSADRPTGNATPTSDPK